MKKLIALMLSVFFVLMCCSCNDGRDDSKTSISSEETVKTVAFPENMTFETLNDEALKNEVYTLLDSIDPLPMDPYWSGYPRATVDDPESYEKIKALGTKAVPYILLYINEHRELSWNDSYYFLSAARTMVCGALKDPRKEIEGYENLEYTDELKELYSEASWDAYVFLHNLAGRTFPEEAK